MGAMQRIEWADGSLWPWHPRLASMLILIPIWNASVMPAPSSPMLFNPPGNASSTCALAFQPFGRSLLLVLVMVIPNQLFPLCPRGCCVEHLPLCAGFTQSMPLGFGCEPLTAPLVLVCFVGVRELSLNSLLLVLVGVVGSLCVFVGECVAHSIQSLARHC